jgi:hypothetical protein
VKAVYQLLVLLAHSWISFRGVKTVRVQSVETVARVLQYEEKRIPMENSI